jgi:competence CoiA-like predicted nuclease
MIKYKFAYNSQNQTIDVQTLSKDNQTEKFRCLGCGHELVAVLGKKRAKHFRHKIITEINCSPETYLHKLAKTKFYEVYQNCLTNHEPFYIKFLTFLICIFYQNDF